MKTLFIGGLPSDASEASVQAMFAEFGTVRSITVTMDIFTGKCKGFGLVQMEGHEARAAIDALDGKAMGEKRLKVNFEKPRIKGRGGRRR